MTRTYTLSLRLECVAMNLVVLISKT